MKAFEFIKPVTKFTKDRLNRIALLFNKISWKYVLFRASQRIIANSSNSSFVEEHNLSNADIYDFGSKKQSFKKWENELGLVKNDII